MKLSNKMRSEIVDNWFKENIKPKYDNLINDFKSRLKSSFENEYQEQIIVAKQNKKLLSDGYLKATNFIKVGGYYGIQLTDLKMQGTSEIKTVDVATYAYTQSPFYFEAEWNKAAYDSLKSGIDSIRDSINQVKRILYAHNTDTTLLADFPDFAKFIPKKKSSIEDGKNLISKDLAESVKALLK